MLICHNSNCEEPPDPNSDDTIEALTASLALQDDEGNPLIDGVELDFFWLGAEDICLYAHDLSDGSNVFSAAEGVQVLIDSLMVKSQNQTRLTRKEGIAFQVFFELKGHVGMRKSEKHSAEQRVMHANCVLDRVEQLEMAANEQGWALEITMNSFDPELMLTLSQQPRLAEIQARNQLAGLYLGAVFGVPPPLDSQTQPLADWPDSIGVKSANVHPHWVRQGSLEAYKNRGWQVAFWMFSQGPETLATIERYEPKWVITNEAATLDRWLKR